MARYVSGEDTSHLGRGKGPVEKLCVAIAKCCEEWEGDPAFKDVLYKLELVKQELDYLQHSPGRRAALRAASFNHAGQEPSYRHAEAPMEVQRTPKSDGS